MIKLLMNASTGVGTDLNSASENTSAETSFVIKEAEKGEDPKEIEEGEGGVGLGDASR